MKYVASILIAASAWAQSVTGVVRDSVTKEAVPDAVVFVLGAGGARLQRGVSDGEGAFTISGVTPGRYRVAAERQGYTESKSTSPVEVREGEAVTGVSIDLVPTGVITGRVLDAKGQPAAGALVSVLQEAFERGKRTLRNASPVGAANRTDDLGEYRLWGLAPGRYFVMARAFVGGWAPLEVATDLAAGHVRYGSTLFPGVLSLSEARMVEVKAGETTQGIHIPLREAAARVAVRTRVVGDPGPEAVRVQITLVSEIFEPGESGVRLWSELVNDLAKTSETQVAPGRYEAEGRASHAAGAMVLKREVVEIPNRPVVDLTFEIQPPVNVRGTVKLESAVTATPRLQVSAENVRAQVGADGAFQLTRLMRGVLDFDVTGVPAGHYVASATMGDRNVWDDGLDLGGGAEEPVQVLIRDGAAQVRGVLSDAQGEPVEGTVVLVPAAQNRRAREHWYRVGRAELDGTFSIADVAPGEYGVFAWRDVLDTAWLNAEFQAAYEASAVPLAVERGSMHALRLTAR